MTLLGGGLRRDPRLLSHQMLGSGSARLSPRPTMLQYTRPPLITLTAVIGMFHTLSPCINRYKPYALIQMCRQNQTPARRFLM